MTLADLSTLVAHWGYPMVFLIAMLASAGAPLPAAEILVAAAIYTAHTHRLNIDVLCGGGFLAASIGGFAGYALGGWLGVAGLRRYGAKVGLGPARQRLGQYLFLEHGGKIVVAIRFIALLSCFGGVLAGVNRMPFGRFSAFNIGGSAVWAVTMAFGGYLFGAVFARLGGPIAITFLVAAAVGLGGLAIYVHRQGAVLQAKADALLLRPATGE